MPGGIGRVSDKVIAHSGRRQLKTATLKNANEIFFNLDSRRVYFHRAERHLYFVDVPQGPVVQTISAVLAGAPLAIEQLHLDEHRYFDGARRIRLTEAQCEPVLIALRLAGIRTTVS